jgi:hypothetical protein
MPSWRLDEESRSIWWEADLYWQQLSNDLVKSHLKVSPCCLMGFYLSYAKVILGVRPPAFVLPNSLIWLRGRTGPDLRDGRVLTSVRGTYVILLGRANRAHARGCQILGCERQGTQLTASGCSRSTGTSEQDVILRIASYWYRWLHESTRTGALQRFDVIGRSRFVPMAHRPWDPCLP